MMRDPHGNIYARCPKAEPYEECAHVLVSPMAYRLESEIVRPAADLHGVGLAMWMVAEQPWLDKRPVARCRIHGAPFVAEP